MTNLIPDFSFGEIPDIKLPAVYDDLSYSERRTVREKYINQQNGLCYHCKTSLYSEAPEYIIKKVTNLKLFPVGFFNYPVHLHHSHETGMTIGAVHCHCNAVLWQYYGE